MPLPVRLAVVTGGHPYNVPAFAQVFRAMKSVDFYVQSLDEFTFDPATAATYDVVLFYHMHRFGTEDVLPWYRKNVFSTLEQLGTTKQGIVVLHHALVAFLDWPLWSELVGIPDRASQYHVGAPVTTRIASAHPITAGLEPWTMPDETYTMFDALPDHGNQILLTTDHPQSLQTLGWTRQFGQSRVFCYQPGHDVPAFENPQFQRVLERGILWTAGQRG